MAGTSQFFANRKVLLFDTDQRRRDGRADSLRERGIDVVCAADIGQAQVMWGEDSYRLVLVDANNSPDAMAFGDKVRSSSPKQLLAFFVGKPGYLSASPLIGESMEALSFDTDAALNERLETVCQALSHRNGFREASLRMLAARYSKRRQGS